jgi:hypothetical protein
MSEELKRIKLMDAVRRFIEDNHITCAETISQTDRVIENAYDFIEELAEIAGYAKAEQ